LFVLPHEAAMAFHRTDYSSSLRDEEGANFAMTRR